MSKTRVEKDLGIKIDNPNKTLSMALLDSYRRVLYDIKKFWDSVDFESIDDIELKIKLQTAILSGGEKLGKNIESLDKLEDKVIREEKAMISRKGSADTAMFES